MMIGIEDFEDENGRTDWKAYREDQVNAGETCRQCGAYIVSLNRIKAPSLCWDCKKIDKPDEISHPSLIRCPKCSYRWNPSDEDDYHIFEEGEHEVCCGECGHDFEISTAVSFNFTSPKTEGGDEDEED